MERHLTNRVVHDLAREAGFDLAGVAAAAPMSDFDRFQSWVDRGLAGKMSYLTDHRAALRSNPEALLPGAKSVISLGLIYNGPEPYSTAFSEPGTAWISRYAWGEDYHAIMRGKIEQLALKLMEGTSFRWRACVDTAPLLERSIAKEAGLGWIGKNTCLINEKTGSWFFIGELLTTLELAPEAPVADRCGTCTRCIDACPTDALIPYELDARRCIAYLNIELRGSVPVEFRAPLGSNVFGCDICQDVCPWNRRARLSAVPEFSPRTFSPPLDILATMNAEQFKQAFQDSPISRARYSGFLRNVCIAMGNAKLEKFRRPLERLAASEDPLIREHAEWALSRLPADGREQHHETVLVDAEHGG